MNWPLSSSIPCIKFISILIKIIIVCARRPSQFQRLESGRQQPSILKPFSKVRFSTWINIFD